MADINKATKKKELPPIIPVPYDPTNLFISKDVFIAKRKAIREAQHKAEEAYKMEMLRNSSDVVDPQLAAMENTIKAKKQLLVTYKEKLAELELERKDDVTDKEVKNDIKKQTRLISNLEIELVTLTEKLEKYNK